MTSILLFWLARKIHSRNPSFTDAKHYDKIVAERLLGRKAAFFKSTERMHLCFLINVNL